MKPGRSKARAMSAVPQSREEVVEAIARIGEIEARVTAAKAQADEAVRAAGEALDRDTSQLLAELKDLRAGVQTWCEAHRDEITNGGRVKFHEFGTGRILWRARPPKVGLRAVELVIESCGRLGLAKFLRPRVEVNKEAMLAEPELARTIAGVTISSEGEDFVIEPAALATSTGR